jgi:two-component system, OmpR family, alkaline phosphatase synthesis response regulator PhoP
VRLHLRDQGYSCDCTADGDDGLKKAISGRYDLVILDVVLPGTDGMEICKRMREEQVEGAILMLTSKSEELDKVLGLELGADDYLTKPFSVRELLARVKAIFRRVDKGETTRARSSSQGSLTLGNLVIELDKYKVTKRGKLVELTAKEFELLKLFASHPGRCYTREQLLHQVWGYDYAGYDHTINTHINRLRAKIEDDPDKPKYIQTLRGVGYRMGEEFT